MPTGGRDEPFVERKGEWTATDKTGVNADRANTVAKSTTPGLVDRGEGRQVHSKPSELGPLDALSGLVAQSVA